MSDRNPSNSTGHDRETARGLNSAAIHLLRAMRDADRQSGLTPARLSALSVLVFGGPSPLGRLAKLEGVASPTMTRIVDGLCRLGLAERTAHPDSATIVMVAATAQGRDAMISAADRRIDAIAAAMAMMSAAERSLLGEAVPLVRQVAAAITNGPG